MHAPEPDDTKDEEIYLAEIQAHNFLNRITKFTTICCWTESEHESNVMWKSYAGPEGVAITTMYGDLLAALHLPEKL